ncbi:MAG TPA: hypothetical protein VI566_02915 [Xanthomonadales bacterium]|nr:hypothetical protein [Xanthomonadales bacterium]
MIKVPGLQAKVAISIATLLALAPCAAGANWVGLPAASFAAGGTGLTSFYVLGFELGPWQEYLAQELTPSYLLPENVAPVRVSWLQYNDVLILPDFAEDLGADADTHFYMNFDWQSSGQYLVPEAVDDSLFTGSMFERQYFTPGFEHELNDNGVLGVAAVIAHQRYSAANLGLLSATTPDNAFFWPSSGYRPFEESGYGTGVSLGLRQEIFSGIAIETEYQSRIDMEDFAAFRGVYASPADLDIPARASVGVDFKTGSRSWLNVAVERVLYSDITAFPSRYLPNRLLSLLGDSTSPSFAWEDLTVYSVGWTWSDGARQEWHIDFSSRSQPSPSSALLSQALKGELAEQALIVGYSRRTGPTSRLNFSAAYAPAEYAFGGSVLGVTTDDLDQRFELEALWTKAF